MEPKIDSMMEDKKLERKRKTTHTHTSEIQMMKLHLGFIGLVFKYN